MSENKSKLVTEISSTVTSGYESNKEQINKKRVDKKNKKSKTFDSKRWQLFSKFLGLNLLLIVVVSVIIGITVFNNDIGEFIDLANSNQRQDFDYSRSLVLGVTSEENLLLANREDNKIEILRYFALDNYQKLFEFDLANTLIDIDAQISYIPEFGIFFLARGENSSSSTIEFLNNSEEREEVYQSNNRILSIIEGTDSNSELLILEIERTGLDLSSNNYEIRSFNIETSESKQISALKSESLYQLERKDQKAYLVDIARTDCYLINQQANVSEILVSFECSEIRSDISKGEFIISTETVGEIEVESFPENQPDFRQTITSRETREEVYVGEINNLLEIVSFLPDAQRIIVFSRDVQGKYYNLLIINTAISQISEEFKLPQVENMEFLEEYKPDEILIFKLKEAENLPAELLAFNQKNNEFYQVSLPVCERDIDICDTEVL